MVVLGLLLLTTFVCAQEAEKAAPSTTTQSSVKVFTTGLPWLRFKRPTDIPERINRRMRVGVPVAGPMVQTIRVRARRFRKGCKK